MFGVERCIVGYSGGVEEDPSYSDMKDYTESVFIEFNKSQITYESILAKWKALSAPYPTDRQYRTAIFFLSQEQESLACEATRGMDNVFVEPVTRFFMAEERHQNFLDRL